jgi:hypothetical protein
MRTRNELSRVFRLGMVLVVSAGLAACAPEEEAELETPETEAPDVEAVEPERVDIESVNSTVEGEATITRTGQDLMVALTLENLPGQGPYTAQLVTGRCDAIEDAAEGDRPATNPPANNPQTTPGMESGRSIGTFDPIQVTGTGTAMTATGHATIPASSIQGATEGALKIMQGSQTVACGNVNNLNELAMGSATPGGAYPGTTPGTPAPGTNPSTTPAPGTRP